MAQSLSKLYVHMIFHVKNSSCKIRKDDSKNLYAYMASIIKKNHSIPILINGVENHVHILCVMSKNIALSKLIEDVKRNSSRWIKTKDSYYRNFAWQGGYSGFSISPSLCDKTKTYIEKQEEHHKKMSFKEEYVLFLREYDIDFNEEYIWSD
ncbi:MAG: transposase [Bacteroidota bacterium]